MKKTIFTMLAAGFSLGASADVIELSIEKPMFVNKTDLEGYSAEAHTAVHMVNTRLAEVERGTLAVTPELDYVANGKIYTVYDLAKMPVEKIIAMKEGDYCAIASKAYTVKKEWNWSKFSNVVTAVYLQGKFKAENWYPEAANYGTSASFENGQLKGMIDSKLNRQYSLSFENGRTAYVSCVTVLRSSSVEEAEAKYNAYASDVFGPIKSTFGI